MGGPGRGATAVVVVAALALAGCTGGSSDDPPTAAPSTEPAPPTVRVLTYNLLHGLFCPEETDWCAAPDRVAIFAEAVEAADCPDLIGLQEVGPRLEELLAEAVGPLCDGSYEVAWEPVESPDRSMVLSRLPIVDRGYLDLAHDPWDAYRVRVDAPPGPVDLVTGHFASSANDPPCAPGECPPACEVGASTNECHAVEVVEELDAQPDGAVLAVVAGDLNAEPGSPTVRTLLDAGFLDAWLAAGQPECDPDTHEGCTGGGDGPEPFVGMDTEAGPGFDTRIDHVLVRPAAGCDLTVDAEAFGDHPRPEPRGELHWASDHAGVLATVGCR